MQYNSLSAEEQQWVIWNGSMGILDTATLGHIEQSPQGRNAWLDEPYEMVGPFNLDELEAEGRIGFAACLLMSRQRWQEDQVALRQEAYNHRRKAEEQLREFQARYNQHRQQPPIGPQRLDDKHHRKSLNLPSDGELQASQIKAAYRRLAQKAHPDVGGSHEQFVQITEARDALLDRL